MDLSDDNSSASKELKIAVDCMKKTGKSLPAQKFKAYSNSQVRDALKDLFNGKCAYCESKIAGSSQTDIEHYRPKGGVHDCPSHPGYWWLAMNWNNLVLSCMHCNQQRRQLILDSKMSEPEIRDAILNNDLITTGKKNAFPTENDEWIVDFTGDLNNEKPLLIDPTVTNPEPLFTWNSEENCAFIEAVDGNEMAITTINVLGLNRRWLCEQRWTKYNFLNMIGNEIREAVLDIDNAQTDREAEAYQRSINNNLSKLALLSESTQPHAAMAREYLAKVKEMLINAI